MHEQLSTLLAKAAEELQATRTRPELEAAKARYVGPNGEFTAIMKQMGSVAKELRPAMGKLVNESKARLQALLDSRLRAIEDSELVRPARTPDRPDPPVARPGPGDLPSADARAGGGVPDPAQGRVHGGRRPGGGDGVLLLRRPQHAARPPGQGRPGHVLFPADHAL